MKTNIFDVSLDIGKRGEAILDAYYERRYAVHDVPLEEEKRGKCDRLLVCRLTGRILRAEWKTDLRMFDTGNVFIELADQDGSPSWGLAGKSDIIVFAFAGWDVGIEVPGPALRSAVLSWSEEFEHKRVTSEGRFGRRLTVIGIAVPISRLSAIASDRIFLPTPVSAN